MAELKTKPTTRKVDTFLKGIPDEEKRNDCRTLAEMMRRVTKAEPRVWGTDIVGFGSYRYRYDSGREREWFLTGFSPRKDSISVYLTAGLDRYPALLAKLGAHKNGKSCLYLKRLSDVDLGVLRELVRSSVQFVRAQERRR